MASNSRGISDISVVLPAPVLPMIAVVCPGWAASEMPERTGAGRTRVGEADVDQLELAPQGDLAARATTAGTTEESVSSTSPIRSAQTAARGIMIAMNVAIITDMRICIR